MIRFQRVSGEEYAALKRLYGGEEQDTSQGIGDAHWKVASQIRRDVHIQAASHDKTDAHLTNASHNTDDAQKVVAFSRMQYQLAQKTTGGDYLIPTRRGIEAFPTCSKYWAWWGLHVVDGQAPRRRRGATVNWNPKMRTLAWKIGKQFVLQGLGYRKIYDAEKRRLQAARLPVGRCPRYEECKAALKNRREPACKGHIDAMARRKAVKMFVAHLYECWRGLEGLPTRPPYALEKLGHVSRMGWLELPDFKEP